MPLLFEDPGMDEFRGLDLRTLSIDHAWIVLQSAFEQPAWLYVRSDDCDQVTKIKSESYTCKELS